MIHNKTEESLEQQTSIRLGGKQQKLGLGHMEGGLKKGMGRGMLKYFNGFCSYYIYLVKFDIFFQKQRVGESRPGA